MTRMPCSFKPSSSPLSSEWSWCRPGKASSWERGLAPCGVHFLGHTHLRLLGSERLPPAISPRSIWFFFCLFLNTCLGLLCWLLYDTRFCYVVQASLSLWWFFSPRIIGMCHHARPNLSFRCAQPVACGTQAAQRQIINLFKILYRFFPVIFFVSGLCSNRRWNCRQQHPMATAKMGFACWRI